MAMTVSTPWVRWEEYEALLRVNTSPTAPEPAGYTAPVALLRPRRFTLGAAIVPPSLHYRCCFVHKKSHARSRHTSIL